jgi:disulfide bond formation protein DsbB
VADTMATFFAILLITGVLGVSVAAILQWTGLSSDLWQGLVDFGLPLAALVAVGATAGSLYFSEGADFVPCEFCWYQRIAMYPLGLITLIAAFIGDRGVWKYALPLAAGGAALSIYHIQLQAFPDQSTSCSLDAPCTSKWVEAFGFATIPVLALMAFALIAALISMAAFATPTAETENEL